MKYSVIYMYRTSFLTPSWDTRKISKDNKILIENLTAWEKKKELGAKKMLKVFLAKYVIYRSGLQRLLKQ